MLLAEHLGRTVCSTLSAQANQGFKLEELIAYAIWFNAFSNKLLEQAKLSLWKPSPSPFGPNIVPSSVATFPF